MKEPEVFDYEDMDDFIEDCKYYNFVKQINNKKSSTVNNNPRKNKMSKQKKLAYFLGAVVLYGVFRLFMGFTDPAGTEKTLTGQGYSGVEITGWRPFAGSKGDFYSTGFRANSPSGAIVTGAVTKGLMKGSTIRLD